VKRTLALAAVLVAIAFAGRARADDEEETSQVDGFNGVDLGIGLWVRRPPTTGSISAQSPSGAQWQVPLSTLGPITETMFDFQTRIHVTRPLYFGTGMSIGWVRAGAASGTYDDYGTPTAWGTEGHGTAITVTGLIGATLYESPSVDLRGEIALGFQAMSIDLDTPQGCTDADDYPTTCSFTRVGLLAEPRLATDFWLSRWSNVGVWAGYDAWPFGGFSFGAAFNFALRADRN